MFLTDYGVITHYLHSTHMLCLHCVESIRLKVFWQFYHQNMHYEQYFRCSCLIRYLTKPTTSSQGSVAAQRSLGRGSWADLRDSSPELFPPSLAAEWQRSRCSRQPPAEHTKTILGFSWVVRLQATSRLFSEPLWVSLVCFAPVNYTKLEK